MHEIGFIYFIMLTTIIRCEKNLNKKLHHYDTLNVKDVRHTIKRRSIENNYGRHISFRSHGKQFDLILEESRDFMAPFLKIVTVNANGKEFPFHLNRDSFYRGHVMDKKSTSDVTAHVDDDGLLTASVETIDETYVIEPMWRHVDEDPSHDMIVFKASDVTLDTASSKYKKIIRNCGYDIDNENVDVMYKSNVRKSNFTIKSRERRETSDCKRVVTNNTCSMLLVADHHFFRTVGRGNKATTAYFMFHTIQRVDQIFRRTCWTGVGKNIGVQVKETRIYTEPNDIGFNGPPPSKNGIWVDKELLNEFSNEKWDNYCLAHLFTNIDFVDSSLGIAWVKELCSERSMNTGLTTHKDHDLPLVRLQADLVTAHEIGHNFGAKHDSVENEKPECRKKYLMHETSVSGAHIDNRQFSVCARERIGKHIIEKRDTCFQDKDSRKCGNSIIDPKEECDPGPIIDDPCCNKDCMLKSKSTCSDYNHLCCKDCQLASNRTVCSESSTIECKGEIKCNGKIADCPDAAPKLKNNEECVVKTATTGLNTTTTTTGICRDGTCKSHCLLETTPCTCSGSHACKVCCQAKGGDCEPVRYSIGSYVHEMNGTGCSMLHGDEGLCMHGICNPLKTKVSDKFKLKLTLDNAINLMKDNIVLTIIMLSLLVWIPASCLVNYLDQEEDDAISVRRSISMHSEQILKSPTTPMKDFPNVVSGQHIGFFT